MVAQLLTLTSFASDLLAMNRINRSVIAVEASKLENDRSDIATLQKMEQRLLRMQNYITFCGIIGLVAAIAIDERCHREDEEDPENVVFDCKPRSVVVLKTACLVSTVILVFLILAQWRLSRSMIEIEEQLRARAKTFKIQQVLPFVAQKLASRLVGVAAIGIVTGMGWAACMSTRVTTRATQKPPCSASCMTTTTHKRGLLLTLLIIMITGRNTRRNHRGAALGREERRVLADSVAQFTVLRMARMPDHGQCRPPVRHPLSRCPRFLHRKAVPSATSSLNPKARNPKPKVQAQASF